MSTEPESQEQTQEPAGAASDSWWTTLLVQENANREANPPITAERPEYAHERSWYRALMG
jgi:hypothetical protein